MTHTRRFVFSALRLRGAPCFFCESGDWSRLSEIAAEMASIFHSARRRAPRTRNDATASVFESALGLAGSCFHSTPGVPLLVRDSRSIDLGVGLPSPHVNGNRSSWPPSTYTPSPSTGHNSGRACISVDSNISPSSICEYANTGVEGVCR